MPVSIDSDAPNLATPYSSTFNVVGAQLQLSYPNQGDPDNARYPVDLRAISWPEGKRIDLRWTNPSDVTRVVIKRSKVSHSAFINDDSEVIYNGALITHFIDGIPVSATAGAPDAVQSPATLDAGVPNTGVALLEDQFYYYTVYLTKADDPIGLLDFGPEASSFAQVTGLSLVDYLNSTLDSTGAFIKGRGEWYYNELQTQRTREHDQKRAVEQGRETGWFQNVCRFLQGCVSLQRGLVRGLERAGDPDTCAPGNVGAAVAQAEYLVNWIRTYGIKAPRSVLDVSILRRIASSWAEIRKIKGRCSSLEDWTKVLTKWDATCEHVNERQTLFLSTWGSQRRSLFSYQANLITVSAGQVFVSPGGFADGEFNGGIFVGPMRDIFEIERNTTEILFFADDTVLARTEDLLTIDAVASLGGSLYRLDVTRTAGGPANLNDNEYNGMQLVDSNGTLMDVDSVEGGSGSTIDVDSGVLPVAGDAAVAPAYLVPGGVFADRVPQFVFQLWTEDPTFIYDPLLDLDLLGEDEDPHDVIYNSGSMFGLPFKPFDITLTIAAGVARATGAVDTVVGNVMTDASADFGPASSLKYFYLNPNRNQKQLFRVIDNTSTSITVESSSDIQLEDVARPNTRYYLLDFQSGKRLELLNEHLKVVTPYPSRVFVFFD